MSYWIYTRDIPFASHNPSSDQPIMQTNANSIDSLILEDHFSFNDNQGGWHKVIHQLNQVADPAAIPTVGQSYLKDNPNGDQNPFFRAGDGTVYNIVNQSGSALIMVPNPLPLTVFTAPNNCIGFIVFTIPIDVLFPANVQSFSFASFSGGLWVEPPKSYRGLSQPSIIIASVNGLQFQVSTTLPAFASTYKYIFWPVA
jgi:hypothetical protein